MKNVYLKWEEVENQSKNAKGEYITEYFISSKIKSRIYFSILDQIKSIFLEFDEGVIDDYDCPVIKGITIIKKKVEHISLNKSYICITNNSSNDEIFLAFVSTICDGLIECDTFYKTISLLEETIKYYKDYFTNKNFSLSEMEERGLCAELIQLSRYIDNYGQKSVLNWLGPNKNKRDFVFDKKSIEVKSTISQTNTNIVISNENQLDSSYPEQLQKLYLKVFVFEKDDNGIDVNMCIKNVLDQLTNVNYYKVFVSKIINLKINISLYKAKYRYTIQDEKYYLVDEKFPSITKKSIPQSCYDVKYRINLSAISDFEEAELYD